LDILNSNWLIKMLEKSSQTPHGRLLSLFDILEDWLDAPTINEKISERFSTKIHAQKLQDFLTLEAAKAGAAMPEALANQLYFMALAAAQEKLQSGNHKSLSHAKNAASALISAQTKAEFHIAKLSAITITASFLAVLIAAGSLFIFNLDHVAKQKQVALLHPLVLPLIQASVTPSETSELTASPEQTAALMAQLELMRHGNCQLIEAIQLPDNQKGIYLNIVVNGQVSTNPHEQQVAMELIKKTRCNYTPMLMANSTG
jgi:hypothetical protein